MLQNQKVSTYCRGRAGAGPPLVYDSYVIIRKKQSSTLNHKPSPFGEEKLVASLIAIPNVDKANRRQEKGKKPN
jgi:hypothetical protein